MRVVGLTILAAALAGGCATPPPDRSGDIPIEPPPTWMVEKEGSLLTFEDGWIDHFEGGDLFEDGWIDHFEGGDLAGLVRKALLHNLDLKAAAGRLEAARATASISGADRWPQVTGSQDNSRRQRTGTSGFAIISRRSDSFSLSLSLSWELDIWGRLRDEHRAAIADWQAAQEDYRAARLSLAARTVQSWFDAVEARLQVRLAEDTVKSFEANLSTIEQRFRSGISRALDLRLTRANVAGARSSLEARKRQRDAAVRRLEVLLGRYPAYSLSVADKLPQIRHPVPAGLPSELLARRPDIAAAERRLAASGARVKVSKKSRLPSIRLTGGGGTSTDEFDQLLNMDFKVWNIASGIAQPILQGGRLLANVKRRQAQYETALADYGHTALIAFREVEGTLASELYLAGQEEALRIAAEESIGAADLAWDQYQRGLNDIMTVLESQRRSFDSQRQLLQISNERLQNRVDLYLALGGDFELEGIEEGVDPSVSLPSPRNGRASGTGGG